MHPWALLSFIVVVFSAGHFLLLMIPYSSKGFFFIVYFVAFLVSHMV